MPTTYLTPLRPVRWCVLVLAACAGQTGFGYQPPGFQRGPSCDTLPPAPCAPPACQPACPPRCQSCCTCQDCREQPRSVPDQPRDAQPRPAAPPSELRETGFYQAGPRSGALEGGHSTFGFRGGALTLPKVRLELPSIELPSFFRTSYAAKMRVAESEAPWTSTGFQRVTYAEEAAQGRGADPQPDARDTAEPRAAAPADLKAKYEAKLEELCRKIEACEQMRQQLEQSLHCPPPYVPAPHCAPAPPPAAPYTPAPQCAPLPHAAAPHATGRPHATTPPRPAGLPPNAPQQTPKAGPNPPVPPGIPPVPPGITAPPSLTTTTGTAVPSPPQPRLPEEVRALPAEPTGGATAGWRSPDAAAGDRTAAEPQPANPQPHDRPLPAPQTPAPNPFGAAPPTATHPAAATPWQPLPPPATAWIPPGDTHAASTAVATGPHSHAKPQRLPSR